jgi:RecA-family ATPase
MQTDGVVQQEEKGLFLAKTANEWIAESKLRPIPNQLFWELWYENEICILFADTGVGKSILAVQIADAISRGGSPHSFKHEVNQKKVLYLDFELTDKQFENRYSENYADHYVWDENLIRVELNPDVELPDGVSYEKYLGDSIDALIVQHGASVLIVDNLTFLRDEMEKANNALPLMKELKALKNKHNLSMMVLAHTPKRDMTKPITRNDVSGSKMLMNFCDSCFAIGESARNKDERYLKQIKQRNCEQVYGGDNVILCHLGKSYNYLGFEFDSLANECELLRVLSDDDQINLDAEIIELKKTSNLSNREIATKLNTNHTRVGRVIKKENL